MIDMYCLLMGGGSGGSGGDSSVVVMHDVDGTLDKTWQEIYDAVADAKIVILSSGDPDEPIASIDIVLVAGHGAGEYYIYFGMGTSSYVANSADDYPYLD